MPFMQKSWFSVVACGALCAGLCVVELAHLQFFLFEARPFDDLTYRLTLFVLPALFYFFSRSMLMPHEKPSPLIVVHFAPLVLPFAIELETALPVLFVLGTGYTAWLGKLIFDLRGKRRRYRFELVFFSVIGVLSFGVLLLGFALPYLDEAYFYHFYSLSIGVVFVMLLGSIAAIPDLVGDLAEAARVKYGVSRLGDIDVDACLRKLDTLMSVHKLYENQDLDLATAAGALGISPHQLSELVNTRLGTSFSRYVHQHRVEAAKAILREHPRQSVLSVGLEVGFRSQSTFYNAFKSVTGMSPGDYRKGKDPE